MFGLRTKTVSETPPYFLSKGKHSNPREGRCANEWLSWLEGSPHSDTPESVDFSLRCYVMGMNDGLEDGPRQRLRPYLGRCLGTKNDGMGLTRIYLLDKALESLSAKVGLHMTGYYNGGRNYARFFGEEAAFELLRNLLPSLEVVDITAHTARPQITEAYFTERELVAA